MAVIRGKALLAVGRGTPIYNILSLQDSLCASIDLNKSHLVRQYIGRGAL